jgi:hypothetical protein
MAAVRLLVINKPKQLTNANSVDANIDSSANRVFVTWWERNQTSNQPVLSTDNRQA